MASYPDISSMLAQLYGAAQTSQSPFGTNIQDYIGPATAALQAQAAQQGRGAIEQSGVLGTIRGGPLQQRLSDIGQQEQLGESNVIANMLAQRAQIDEQKRQEQLQIQLAEDERKRQEDAANQAKQQQGILGMLGLGGELLGGPLGGLVGGALGGALGDGSKNLFGQTSSDIGSQLGSTYGGSILGQLAQGIGGLQYGAQPQFSGLEGLLGGLNQYQNRLGTAQYIKDNPNINPNYLNPNYFGKDAQYARPGY